MKSIKVCEYSRSRSFHDDLMLQHQASGESSQDHWSSGCLFSLQCHCAMYFYSVYDCSKANECVYVLR